MVWNCMTCAKTPVNGTCSCQSQEVNQLLNLHVTTFEIVYLIKMYEIWAVLDETSISVWRNAMENTVP